MLDLISTSNIWTLCRGAKIGQGLRERFPMPHTARSTRHPERSEGSAVYDQNAGSLAEKTHETNSFVKARPQPRQPRHVLHRRVAPSSRQTFRRAFLPSRHPTFPFLIDNSFFD